MEKSKTIIISVLATAVIVLAGYYVYVSRQSDSKKTVNTPAVTNTVDQQTGDQTADATSSTQPTFNTFEGTDVGYVINYPLDWIGLRQASSSVIMFSGAEGTEAYNATLNIQNLMTTKTGGKYTDAVSVVKDMKDQVQAGAKDIKYTMDKEVTYTSQKGVDLKGWQFVVEYNLNGKINRQWQVIIPRPEGGYIYMIAYTAPTEIFDKYLDVAQAMVQSWTMLEE